MNSQLAKSLQSADDILKKTLRKHVASDGTAHHYRRGKGNAYQSVGRQAGAPEDPGGVRNRPVGADQVTQDDDSLEVPLPYRVPVSDDSDRQPV